MAGNHEEKGRGEPVIGIDFGYYNCCVALWNNDRAEVIPNDDGHRITPSYVAFTEDNQVLIGNDAKDQGYANPANTIYGLKPLLGRKFSDLDQQYGINSFPFKVIEGRNNEPLISIRYEGETKLYQPQLVAAINMLKLKDSAEKYVMRPIKNVVLTVPSFFDGSQRKAIKDAATIAGFNVLRIINEPASVAVAYGLNQIKENTSETRNIMMFHLGYVTLDVSLMNFRNSVVEMKATVEDTELGGNNFDSNMMGYIKERFRREHKLDIPDNYMVNLKLLRACKDTNKQFLANTTVSAAIQIESLYKGINFSESITRSKFEELNSNMFENYIVPVKQCLKNAKMGKVDVNEVVLVGGYSFLAKIRNLLEEFFEGKVLFRDSFNPDEALAIGAAIVGAMIANEEQGEEAESVLKDFDLKDAIPLSLGLESKCAVMEVIIKKDTHIPIKKTRRYTTSHDNQTTMIFKVYEGEKPIAKDNHLLGYFQHKGIAPAAAGEPEVEVSFDVDRNGMLQVVTLDNRSGKTGAFRVSEHSERLSREEINKMIKEEELLKSDYENNIKKLLCLSVNPGEVKEHGTVIQDDKTTEVMVEDDADVGVQVPDGPVIGIDLGTSNSCVSVWDNKDVQIIIDSQGNRIIPSYVAFTEEDEVLFGDAAKSQMTFNSSNTIFGIKRLVGRKFSDQSVQEDMKSWPFKVVQGSDDEPEIIIKNMEEEVHYSPQQILSIVLQNLKELAEKMLNRGPIEDAVVTIPVYFRQSQCMVITKAAEAAGLKIHRFITEPTAAAVTYTIKYKSNKKRNVLVFDLGGGTLDVSLLEMENSIVVVKAVEGDPHLGGDDFDKRLMDYLCKKFYAKHHVDLIGKTKSIGKLKKECEDAKKRLCARLGQHSTRVEIEALHKGIDFVETIGSSLFEKLNEDLFQKCMEPVKRCLEKSELMVNDVDEVILVGGSSQIPKIRELLRNLFKGKTLFDSLQPEEVVASGAAIVGAKLGGKRYGSIIEFNLKDVTPASLGLGINDGSMKFVIPRNTQLPTKTKIFLPLMELPKSLCVYEGEKHIAEHNLLLGELRFPSIARSSPDVTCTLEVSFYVDVNNVVQVAAKDIKLGIIVRETFSDGKGRLSTNEIAKMIWENEKISSHNKDTQRKLKVLEELNKYMNLVLSKLNNENIQSRLGGFVHDHLHLEISKGIMWSDKEGRKAEVKVIIQLKKNIELIVKPFAKDLGI